MPFRSGGAGLAIIQIICCVGLESCGKAAIVPFLGKGSSRHKHKAGQYGAIFHHVHALLEF